MLMTSLNDITIICFPLSVEKPCACAGEPYWLICVSASIPTNQFQCFWQLCMDQLINSVSQILNLWHIYQAVFKQEGAKKDSQEVTVVWPISLRRIKLQQIPVSRDLSMNLSWKLWKNKPKLIINMVLGQRPRQPQCLFSQWRLKFKMNNGGIWVWASGSVI